MDDHGWRDAPLAVIGMACRLPGANQLDEYWDLISRAGCALGPLPPARFDESLYFDPRKGITGKSYSRMGGVVDAPPFDLSRYPLSAEFIASCDPVHLTFLEVAGDALRHAGLEPFDLSQRNTGVFVGNARGGLRSANLVCTAHAYELADHLMQTAGCGRLAPATRTEVATSFAARLIEFYGDPDRDRANLEANRVAGLVAEVFRLNGPAMAVDAACASSLLGLAQAARALQRGRIEMAIVGGASYSAWTSLVLFSQAQALSATGSFPFDARADGFVSSDGYAAVIVKTLQRALADGDRVWGVIRGMGVSSDGRGKSLWAPRREGQVLAIRRALAAGVDASRIGYVEAHGTSTQLGDATEIAALTEGLGPLLPESQRIPVASVKANIGHTRETAGLAGLIKTILAMQHGQIPPAAGFEQPNSEIPWQSIPFTVPTSPSDWAPGLPGGVRRAAIDAFGIGGLNVHVVVDDAPEHRPGSIHALVPGDLDPATQPAPASTSDDVAIIGRGAIVPGALTFAAFRDFVLSGRDARSDVPRDRWNVELFPQLSTTRGGFVDGFEYDWRKHRVPPRQIANADPLQFMVLDAAEQALQEGGCLDGGLDLNSTAVVIGAGFGGDFSIELALALRVPEFQQLVRECLTAHQVPVDEIEPVCAEFADLVRSRYSGLQDETASYSASTLASRVAKTLDLKGGAFAVDAGGGSSLAALSAAVDLLESGACSAVLCAGAQRALDPSVFQSLHVRGYIGDSTGPTEESSTSEFAPGEGCGVLLLKRRLDAERDGNEIRGVIRGMGVATFAGNRRAACAMAAARALSAASTPPTAVEFFEPTGIALNDVDADELAGLAETYGERDDLNAEQLDTIARRVGYSNGASGMSSLLKLLVVLPEQRPSRASAIVDSASDVQARNGNSRQNNCGGAIRTDNVTRRILGAVNSLTPSGQAYHVIVEHETPTPRNISLAESDVAPRILRFEASSRDELLASLHEWRINSDPSPPSPAAFSPHGAVRLAIVVRDSAAAGQQIDLALHGLTQPAAGPVLGRRGIFSGTPSAVRPRIAFAFAGQGSQYAGMLRTLVGESPVAAEELRHVNRTLSELELPAFEQLAWVEGDQLGRDLFRTQLSVLLADVVLFRVLTASGIVPDVIAAHSYGEYAALVAAGAWELAHAIELTRVRCQAIAACDIRGGMLATTAPIDRVEFLLRDFKPADRVFVANYNSPGQTILAGSEPALTGFEQCLLSDGHETRLLPVPGPFHTPLMAPVQPLLRAAVAASVLRPPMVPLLSSVTNRFAADPHDLRDNLVEQLVRPVRYVDLVRRLTEEGIDILVEVGPRDVLTNLHRQILGEGQVGTIATDDARHPGVEQLLRVQALLECRGAQLSATSNIKTSAQNGQSRRTQPDLESGPILHFDATANRRERNRRAAAATDGDQNTAPSVSRNGAALAEGETDELAGFLIRFVCEQTGYPPEVVDLDAELEADLGIDSIKKAQLLGELREHFPLQPAGRLSLDAFPTLRHILEFIRESKAAAPAFGSAARRSPDVDATVTALIVERRPTTGSAVSPTSQVAIRSAAEEDQRARAFSALNVRTFRGTPYDMGGQHGRLEEQAIRRTLQKYAELLGERLFEMRPLQAALEHRDTYFGNDGLAELQGIADAIGMPVEHLAAFNYGLSMEFLPGCTQFAVSARRNGSAGLIHAVNEDWMLALALPGTLKRMAQVRFPAERIPFFTLSTCGELAGQNGINARGLSVTSTLLLDRLQRNEAIPGRVHPALVKELLERADTIEAALEIVRSLPRCGAWSMCLSHRESDRLCYVEYDAASVQVRWSAEFVESTNHCLLQPALGETPAQSCQRLERLHELLHSKSAGDSGVTVQQAQSILRDRYDRSLGRVTTHPTKATIRRPYTQASLVLRPATGDVWVTADSVPADEPDRFHHLSLADLFSNVSEELRPSTAATAPAPLTNDDPAQCRAVPDRIMNRFVLRMRDAALPDDRTRQEPIAGRVLLLGENPTADALRRQLVATGADVLSLPAADAEAAVQELERVWKDGPAPMLLLLTARDADAASGVAEEPWRRRRERGVLLPYRVCQRWVELVTRSRLSVRPRLVAATGLEGDFGLSGRSTCIEGGALTGLLKAIRHEFDQISTKIIDAPLTDPAALVARCLVQEVESGAPDVEVAYVCGRRRLLEPVPRRLVGGDQGARPQGTWIVTGGGRGVTARVAREFGRRYGLSLHLLGSSPKPEIPEAWSTISTADRAELRRQIIHQARQAGDDPVAKWRDVERRLELAANLREFAASGVAATYHCCDVTDRRQLTRVLEEVRAADGPIRGILHGAGVEAACRFDKKSLSAVEQTLAVKVDAAMSLAELTSGDPVEFLIGFGSISGRFGGHGQTDYSLASDLLAKVMGRLRRERPDCRAVAIHWPVWGETGMAMRPESKLALELAGHRFMPPVEGAAHLFDELEAGAPEGEVLLYDWPATRGTRRSPWSPAEAGSYWRQAQPASTAPLITGIVRLNDEQVVTELAFNPQSDPFLVHHRIDDVPILPLVVALESFAEASQLLRPGGVQVFRNVQIHEGLRFPPGASDCARVEVRLAGGQLACELRSDFRNRRGSVADPSRLHVSAVMADEADSSSPTFVPIPENARWSAMVYDTADETAIKRVVSHGPPLQCLHQICIAGNRLWGRIRAGSSAALCPSPQKPDWLLPSATLDACLLACSVLAYVQKKPFHLPCAVERLRFHSPPSNGEECLVAVCCREENADRATYDLVLCGADGRIILDACGYQAAFLKGTPPATC